MATAKRWDGASFVALAHIRRWSGAAWVDVGFLRRWSGSAWVNVWPLLSALASPTSSSTAFVNDPPSASPGTRNLTSASVTVTAAGGTAGYTYAWTRVSGSVDVAATSAASATTTFSATGVPIGGEKSAVFRCTVTDAVSDTTTVDVNVSFTYDSGL